MSHFRIDHSYTLDLMNFISVLTGNEFYTSRHEMAYELWAGRLTEQGQERLAKAQEEYGSHMLGPVLSLVVSALPDFEAGSVPDLLKDTNRLHHHFQRSPYYSEGAWPSQARLCQAVAEVVQELEEAGFRAYWEAERLPLIAEAKAQLNGYLQETKIDLPQLLTGMLDSFGTADDEEIVVYVCSFAAPHGIKICGRRFISDVRYEPKNVLRIAIHEMFHPPYNPAAVEQDLQAIINDPLFQAVYAAKDPIYGYSTEMGFLEENVVEAASLLICHRAGIIEDPVAYLSSREGGVYKVGVILLGYFSRIPKAPAEPFGRYFQRVVAQLPLGRLEEEYNSIIRNGL